MSDVEDDRWFDAWLPAATDLHAALDEPGVLDRTVAHPLGSFPAPVALGVYAGELATHGWDLAAALERTSLPDQDLAAACLGPIRSFLPAAPASPALSLCQGPRLRTRVKRPAGRR